MAAGGSARNGHTASVATADEAVMLDANRHKRKHKRILIYADSVAIGQRRYCPLHPGRRCRCRTSSGSRQALPSPAYLRRRFPTRPPAHGRSRTPVCSSRRFASTARTHPGGDRETDRENLLDSFREPFRASAASGLSDPEKNDGGKTSVLQGIPAQSGRLSGVAMHRNDAWATVKRRCALGGLPLPTGFSDAFLPHHRRASTSRTEGSSKIYQKLWVSRRVCVTRSYVTGSGTSKRQEVDHIHR